MQHNHFVLWWEVRVCISLNFRTKFVGIHRRNIAWPKITTCIAWLVVHQNLLTTYQGYIYRLEVIRDQLLCDPPQIRSYIFPTWSLISHYGGIPLLYYKATCKPRGHSEREKKLLLYYSHNFYFNISFEVCRKVTCFIVC